MNTEFDDFNFEDTIEDIPVEITPKANVEKVIETRVADSTVYDKLDKQAKQIGMIMNAINDNHLNAKQEDTLMKLSEFFPRDAALAIANMVEQKHGIASTEIRRVMDELGTIQKDIQAQRQQLEMTTNAMYNMDNTSKFEKTLRASFEKTMTYTPAAVIEESMALYYDQYNRNNKFKGMVDTVMTDPSLTPAQKTNKCADLLRNLTYSFAKKQDDKNDLKKHLTKYSLKSSDKTVASSAQKIKGYVEEAAHAPQQLDPDLKEKLRNKIRKF